MRLKNLRTAIILYASLLASLILCPLCVTAQDNAHRKDSLRRVIARTEGTEKRRAQEALVRLYLVEVRKEGVIDTLMTIYDALETDARAAGDIETQGLAKSNRISAFFNKGLYDDVIGKAPETLAFLAQNELWKDYYQTYNNMVEAHRRKGDYDRALEVAQHAYNSAKERDDRGGMGMAQLAISKIYSSLRRYPEAEQCMRECIDLLQDQTLYLNYLSTAYNRLAVTLIGQQRYDEALETLRATEEVNRRYEKASGSPQPNAWYNLWLTCTDLYRQTGEFDKAQLYVDKIDSITKGGVKMYKERGHILYGKKRYAEALEMLDSAIRQSPNSLEPKGLKLMTLAQMRESEKAVKLFSEVVGELDAQHNERFNARLDEIRTQYEVDKHIAEKLRNKHYFLFALAGCLLLAVLLAVAAYYNRVITRKNIGLYNRIKEQDKLEEELGQLRALVWNRTDEKIPEGAAAALPGDKQQRELVERMHEYLLREDNLIQAEMNRDELVSALGTNKNTLTEAVKTVTGKTPMEYIRTLQLDEARKLLDRHPELTIEAIATECGFNAPNTFYRLFRKQYGISPAEYRKILRTQQG